MDEVFVGTVDEFDDNARKKLVLDGTEIVVLRWREEFHAFENRCAHMGGPVGEGIVIGRVKAMLGEDRSYLGEEFDEACPQLVCPWHGWEYDLGSGRFPTDDSLSIKKFDVRVAEGAVYVRT